MPAKSPAALARRAARKKVTDAERYRRRRLVANPDWQPRLPGTGVRSEASKQRRREASNQYKKDHPEQHRESQRRWRQRMRAEDPEKLHELDAARARRQAAQPGFKAKRTEQNRRRMKTNPAARAAAKAAAKRFIHGTPEFAEIFAAMWSEQDGKCYLCSDPLVPGRTTHVDHDHSCCPKGKTCADCRRGLACEQCNHVIGHAHDDPGLLRRIADNFEPVLIATRARIAARMADQLSLWEEAS